MLQSIHVEESQCAALQRLQKQSWFWFARNSTDMLKTEGFLIPETYQRWYNTDPLHKLFVGEILAAYERMDAWADDLQNL